MRVSELKQKIQNGNLLVEEFVIKTYLPLTNKSIIAEQVCEDVIEFDDNGMAFVNRIQKTISVSLSILLNYCDVEIDEDTLSGELIEVLDLLFEKKLFSEIENKIGNDVFELDWAIDDEIDNLKVSHNSLEAVLANGVSKLIKVINDNTNPKQLKSLIKTVSKEFKGFDVSKLGSLQDLMKAVGK